MYLLGLDIGSSSIKAAIVDADTQQAVATASYPSREMEISAPQPSWAEQDPEIWWKYANEAIRTCLNTSTITATDIKGIGISYQMHGLVTVDKQGSVVRPSIIWCDSRAVGIGEKATAAIGQEYCTKHYLNAPGNFTASKLRWVKENEPNNFERIHKIMLPGDYIAFKMTGEINTTISGLSEGILWDFKEKSLAHSLLKEYEIDQSLLADIKPTFSIQGELSSSASEFLGLAQGTPVSYRAGDQPNNAMSLGVYKSGQVAGTGGTSGVVYAVTDTLVYDPDMRVNSFAHVNYTTDKPNIGVLLCINGCGITYNWLRKTMGDQDVNYGELERRASEIKVGSEGLSVLSFGNGAERMLKNQDIGAQIIGLNYNIHSQPHLYRAGLEGIAFAFYYGVKSMQQMGVKFSEMRVGNDNLFQSNIFTSCLANLSGAQINIVDTNGAIGAALGAGVGISHYADLAEAFKQQEIVKTTEPKNEIEDHLEAFERWSNYLNKTLEKP